MTFFLIVFSSFIILLAIYMAHVSTRLEQYPPYAGDQERHTRPGAGRHGNSPILPLNQAAGITNQAERNR